MADVSSPALVRPTRVRLGVLAFVCALAMITYLDRGCFPNVQQQVLDSLDLKRIDELRVPLTAFQLAYALFEVPTGWLGDRFGPRRTLIRIVLWWSFFIALTGMVGRVTGIIAFGYTVPEFTLYGFWALVIIRFLFGMGEAGAFPNIARALYNWFPLRERGRASGAVWMTARLMGGLTPLVMTMLVADLHLHWRGLFLVFGFAGVVWAIAFGFWFRNKPEEHPSVNEAERQLIASDSAGHDEIHSAVPWRRILSNRSVWALCLMYVCGNYSWYFSMNYLPAFLHNQYGVGVESRIGAIFKGGPMLLGMAGCFVGGWLTDQYIRRTGNRKWGRRLFGLGGHVLAGLCMLACIFVPSLPAYAVIFASVIALSGFFNDVTMAPTWAACQDVGKRYSAIVSGCMNMIGNLGGALTTFISPSIVRFFIERQAALQGVESDQLSDTARNMAARTGWDVNFAIYGAVYLLAIFFWMNVNASKPIAQES
ncbi:MAG TPA: MFS transporter [Gemmataceae bacterium]|jgi:sugar phosphate permease|nr:MFS transporter [Gemmataceae bacterium]